jgi:glycosyltransferase involved in cell wall biosynthesis
MAVSLCITVFNEEKYIDRLLESIIKQTKQPNEVVIVDGGSSDRTVSHMKQFETRIRNLKIISKKGNRPVGRNESIRQAKGDIIAITDAGCELSKTWLEELMKPFESPKTQVVSGYYAGKAENAFQEALLPYVLVMPDKVNPLSFLPSTRSMALRKHVWEKLGGFPQEYRWNEDYVFSKRIEKAGIPIAFAPKAIVYWFPRESIMEGWNMFYAFAKGDTQAGIWRKKVIFLLIRVIFAGGLLGAGILLNIPVLLGIFGVLSLFYMLWAMLKNFRYVNSILACIYLPIWQLISDSAVFIGSLVGVVWRG